MSQSQNRRRSWIRALSLIGAVMGIGVALAAWKNHALRASDAPGASAEPVEAVSTAVAESHPHRSTVSAIGTVRALRSITLRNELPGSVRRVALTPGRIVEPGDVLVALDVSVETADLHARQAQLALAQTTLDRMLSLVARRAVSQEDVDRARAERDVAAAEIERIKATIERKTIRAPFRARVGLSDVHVGQYLSEGTDLTTLQSVEPSVHVDFAVSQSVAAQLRVGDSVLVDAMDSAGPEPARIEAIDALVDPSTRNAEVRARVRNERVAAPGASVRVTVPLGQPRPAVGIPVSALRRGPEGTHVWVIEADSAGKPRAHLRPVVAGDVLGDEVLILRGVAVGDTVAASGSFKLRDGALVASEVATAGDR